MFTLQAWDKQFVQWAGNALVTLETNGPGAKIEEVAQPNGTIALLQDGKFWSAQPDGAINSRPSVAGDYEYFQRVPGQRSKSIAYRSLYLNRYVSAPHDGPLTCSSSAVNDWESFDIPQPSVPALDDLGVSGLTFANGWQYKGATDFRLFELIFSGKDITPVLKQRQDAGANIHRAFSMCGNLFHLDPDDHSDSDYIAAIKLVNDYGQRLEIVAEVDCAQPLTKSLSWQQAHLERMGSFTGRKNLCELGNEINNFYQNVNPMDFTKPAGCLSARGDITGYGNWNLLPAAPHAWDYATIHGDRDEDWLQKLAKAGIDLAQGFPGYAGTHCPLVHNEPTKAPYPRTAASDWFIAGVQCSVWRGDGIGGGVFHCDAGLQSQLWNDEDLARATQFYRGMTAAV